MTGITDHLWQSLLCVALLVLLVRLTRGHAAAWRLWMWRVAAIKLLLPFSLFFAIGSWLGFPVSFAGDPPPAYLVNLVHLAEPWFSAGEWFDATTARTSTFGFLLLATAATARLIFGNIHKEAGRAAIERFRLEVSPDDREPNPGFLRTALITVCPLIVLSIPLLGGAIHGSVHAHEVLMTNTRSLSQAPVVLRPARTGMGSRYVMNAHAGGVQIRNVTLRELAALAYGVSRFYVRGEHFRYPDQEDWLIDTRYDVHIEAPVLEPGKFNGYALRQPITRELATNFGLEIYVNDECQKPCGKWGDRVLVEVAPGIWSLVPKEQAAAAASVP